MKEFRNMRTKMKKTLKGFEDELTTIRAGRANPHILDKTHSRLLRNTYTSSAGSQRHCSGGTYDPDSAMGNQPDQRRSRKQSCTSDLGLNPNNDGKIIRLVLPGAYRGTS